MRFVLLQGWAVVDGYQPDGDTLRFVPDDLSRVLDLPRAHLAQIGADTSVSVRLEGIDAPELHYAGARQPAAQPALDALLREIGWPPPLSPGGPGGAPRGVRVAVVTRSCDSHGRVIGYLFPSRFAGAVSAARVEASVNARLLAAGLVYPLAYRTQPKAHQQLFRRLALGARSVLEGVWARDRSRDGFELRSDASLGPHGALVFPKIFRRSVTYFREAARGVGFRQWLRDGSGADDEVRVGRGPLVRLSDLVREDAGGVLRLTRDLLAMTFAEA